jgi:transcriptional regulator with XRE-family HTH domain
MVKRKYKQRIIKHDIKVGKRIKRLRRQQELTQEKLAEMVKVTPHHLSYIETGKRRPSLSLARRLTRALKTNLGKLFAP